jgi:hypothetical protein
VAPLSRLLDRKIPKLPALLGNHRQRAARGVYVRPGRDAPWDRHTGAIGILRIKFVPEPAGPAMLAAGVGLLTVLYWGRSA